MKKKYYLADAVYRKNVDLRKYEYQIRTAYDKVMPWVNVEVFDSYYTVDGRWSRYHAIEVGKVMGRTELGKYSIYYGGQAKMFASKKIG